MKNLEQNNTENTPTTTISDWVLLNNHQCIALNKPVGMPTQADKTGDKSLLDLAEAYTKTRLHAVHRLDRTASGVILLAKSPRMMALLSAQFEARTVEKIYWAVVSQLPEPAAATLQHWIVANGSKNVSNIRPYDPETAAEAQPNEQLAVLDYRVLHSSDRYHLLEVRLQTGRHHQIRAQLAAIGCPIKGDVKYGARRSNPDRSIHLHARSLTFAHPVTDEPLTLTAPVPNDALWQFFEKAVMAV
jgi:23S rRNA pseudouridine1911/1915/1917 synthase